MDRLSDHDYWRIFQALETTVNIGGVPELFRHDQDKYDFYHRTLNLISHLSESDDELMLKSVAAGYLMNLSDEDLDLMNLDNPERADVDYVRSLINIGIQQNTH
jgi:hypothetical protein